MNTCHDCGVHEGQTHEYGCDMERCPFCNGQLISCSCIYEQLDLDCSFGSEIYETGPSREQVDAFVALLADKGRIPYIQWPILCEYCGKKWPDLFKVPDDEWKGYIEPAHRRNVVCRPCYDKIKAMIDNGKDERKDRYDPHRKT